MELNGLENMWDLSLSPIGLWYFPLSSLRQLLLSWGGLCLHLPVQDVRGGCGLLAAQFPVCSGPGKHHPVALAASGRGPQELTMSQCWLMSEDSHGLTTISLPFSVPSPNISVSRQRWDAMCSMWEPVLVHRW